MWFSRRPVHEHDLRIREKEDGGTLQRCGGCGGEIPDQMSHWCAICRYYFHETCAKLALEIKHFFHPHPLFLCTVIDGFICNSCFRSRFKVFVYRCERCRFDMCLECTAQSCEGETGKEQVLHCCHRHPLQPLEVEPKSLLSCQICDLPGPTWGCEPCNFRLHKPCLDFLPQIVEIQAASWVLITSSFGRCIGCDKSIQESLDFRKIDSNEHLCIFCCLVGRLIEGSSSKVSKVINLPIHPCPYDLKLILSPASSSTCNACLLSHHPFSYHCHSCDFFLCLDCALLPHLFHWHPLTLLTERDDTHSFECTTCNLQCSGLAYYYTGTHGRKCLFCVKCVLSPENVLGDDRRFKSILHWHQLSLCETRLEHKRRRCFLCKELCIPWTLTYKCGECNFFFHKSCAELPAKLEHPIHPQHPLALTNRTYSLSNEDMACKLCLKSLSQHFPLYDLVYRCHKCGFQLDTQCAANCLPSVEYKGHPHLLRLVVNMHGNTYCQVCGESCKGSCTFRCAENECAFNLHLQCGPLPRTVKHVCHVHLLILKDYYVEDNGSDEFACHICEEYRDPRLRVYHCSQGCLMVCDVECVLNEVLALLRGERGEVELITPFPQVACRVINTNSDFAEVMLDTAIKGAGDEDQNTKVVFLLDELFHFVLDFEEEETFGIELLKEENKSDDKMRSECGTEDESREEESIETGTNLDEGESIETGTNPNEEVKSYSFSWNALSRFKKGLRTLSKNDLELKFMRKYDGSIMTGTYALPKILGPIYEEFFERYNIIDHKCKLNYSQRRHLVFITCAVIYEMRIIKVVDVIKETILQWLGFIKFVEKMGKFNVGIVAQNIKQLWQAHYYIQSKKIVDDKTSRLERELEQVSMYQAEQRTKIDELLIKVYEAEATRQELLMMEKEHEIYRVVGSRGPMKKVRSDALEIKWRTCYDSLVLYPGNLPTK